MMKNGLRKGMWTQNHRYPRTWGQNMIFPCFAFVWNFQLFWTIFIFQLHSKIWPFTKKGINNWTFGHKHADIQESETEM